MAHHRRYTRRLAPVPQVGRYTTVEAVEAFMRENRMGDYFDPDEDLRVNWERVLRDHLGAENLVAVATGEAR